jgi:hypothetical protein
MSRFAQRPSSLRRSNPLCMVLGLLAAAAFVCAQPPGPSAEGLSMGHVHLIAKDPQVVQRLWIDVLGAMPTSQGALEGVRLKGMSVWIEKGEPSGGTEGSVIRDIGLRVRGLDGVLARAARNGFLVRQASRDSAQLLAPDKVLIELARDPSLDTEVSADHIHLLVPDAALARRWYSERLGYPIPDIRLDFITAGVSTGPTRGRAVDHIGFEVKDLDSYLDPARGFTMESAPMEIPELRIRSVFLTDPWGMRIELTEEHRSTTQELPRPTAVPTARRISISGP